VSLPAGRLLRVCLLLAPAVFPRVAFFRLFFLAVAFLGAVFFFANFLEAFRFGARFAGLTFRAAGLFDFTDFFLVLFLAAIRAV